MNLLRFLAGLVEHTQTTKTLTACTGYDVAELQIAVSTALEAGFVEPTGQIHPSLRLTADGHAWAKAELSPFKRLFYATASTTQAAVFVRGVA